LLAPYTFRRAGWEAGEPLRFLHGHHTRGHRHARWNGGRFRIRTGYIVVRAPDHPHATVRGTVFEHRLVMERMIGRYLEPHEIVHHRDGDRGNNAPDNLELMERPAHARLHAALPGWSREHARCVACGTTEHRHEARGYCVKCYWRSKRTRAA